MDKTKFQEHIKLFHEQAEAIVERLGRPYSGIEFGYNRESVKWVEGYIERERLRWGPEESVPEGLIFALGAFLGECIIRATGGRWVWNEDCNAKCVEISLGVYGFPHAKVRKQFEGGLEDGESILSFYCLSVDFLAQKRLGADLDRFGPFQTIQ